MTQFLQNTHKFCVVSYKFCVFGVEAGLQINFHPSNETHFFTKGAPRDIFYKLSVYLRFKRLKQQNPIKISRFSSKYCIFLGKLARNLPQSDVD